MTEQTCKICGQPHRTGSCLEDQLREELGVGKKIDLTPSYEDQYERSKKMLFDYMGKLTAEDMEMLANMAEEGDESSDIIRAINSLKTMGEKSPMIEKLARNNLFELRDLKNTFQSKSINNVIAVLFRTCEGLANARFPEDVKKQEKWRDEDRAKETEKMKQRAQKFKHS